MRYWMLAGAAACLVVCIGPAAAADEPINCDGPVSVHARAGIPRGVYDRYDARPVARRSAIAAWYAKVKAECPGANPSWAAARMRVTSCAYFSGGAGCEARAIPRKAVP